jgi:ribulose-phosphate 3-epimerase
MTKLQKQIISPSILAADFSKLEEEIRSIEAAGATHLHLDIMDGHFVPNLTFGPFIVKAIRKLTNMKLEAHLMISNANKYLESFIRAGADQVQIHIEACSNMEGAIKHVRELGASVGVVLNPDTPFERVEPFLGKIDQVLFMSVFPGFGGQKFMPEVLKKIIKWQDKIHESGALIEIDGGVNIETLPSMISADIDIFVAGSAIFNKKNTPNENFTSLNRILKIMEP